MKKAMIFAAGLGTRLKPITDSIPKAMLPIAGKPLLQHQLEKLRDAGLEEIVINVHHFPEQIVSFCRENHDFGLQIHFSDETAQLLETGGGLRKAKELLRPDDEPILVCNVDILSNIDIAALIRAHRPERLATIVVSARQTQRYFLFNRDGELRGWTNIASGELRPASLHLDAPLPTSENVQFPLPAARETDLFPLAFSGMQIVSPCIFDVMAPYPDKFSITDFYLDNLAPGAIHAFVPADYRMMDIGKIDHLQEAEAFALSL